MGRIAWLALVFAGLLVVTQSQDISRSSPLFFPDGEAPSVHHSAPSETKPTSASDSEWRLPRDVLPIRYNLTIHINPNIETFSGVVEVLFYCVNETKTLTLHASNLNVAGSFPKIYDYYNKSESFSSITSMDIEHETITYSLDHNLKIGHTYFLNIEFNGQYSDKLNGLYRSNYTENGETKRLAVTHFEPTHARKMFPCFDEPNLKAYFRVNVYHPREFIALSNSPLQSKQEIEIGKANLTISTFNETVKMSTYLLAVVVSEYKNFSKGDNRSSVWARSNIISGGEFSQGLAVDALQRLENYTDIRFPMGKIDHVAIPHFGAGAMENYGLITYKEPYLTLEENNTKTPTKIYTVTVIAHELAHQWFGNLVTLEWWSYTWLNEAFATFVAYHLPGENASWRLREQFVPAKYQAGMEVDQDPATSIPMTSNVEKPDEIASKFDPISYSKGGSILRMFEHILGKDVFQEAVKSYLIKRSTHNANPEQLFQEFQKVSNKSEHEIPKDIDWSGIGRSWTTKAGLPVLTVTRNYVSGEIRFDQRRFCAGEGADKCQEATWWIPFQLTFLGDAEPLNKTQMYWIGENGSTSMRLEIGTDKWVLVNPKAMGYYRVDYDETNWKLLSDALIKKPTDFPTESRAQILHDTLHFAMANEALVSRALHVSQFLQNEEDVVVWMTGVKVLRSFHEIIGPIGDKIYGEFEDFAQKLLANVYAKNRINSGLTDEGIEKALIRAYIAPYACMFGIDDCLNDARILIEKVLDGSRVHPDLETAVTCGGVKAAGEDIFWKVREKALKESPISDVLLAALSCSRRDTLIIEHLRRAVTEETFPKNKISLTFETVVKSIRSFDIGYNFIHDNFKNISTLIGDGMKDLLRVVCSQVRTTNQYQLVDRMLESNKYNIQGVDSLKKELLRRSYIVDRNKKLSKSIADWFAIEAGKDPNKPGNGNNGEGGSSKIKPALFLILISFLISIHR